MGEWRLLSGLGGPAASPGPSKDSGIQRKREQDVADYYERLREQEAQRANEDKVGCTCSYFCAGGVRAEV
jgi:hypothetical protein